jgi:hypothetical protein
MNDSLPQFTRQKRYNMAGTALAEIQKELALEAANIAQQISSTGGNKIKTKDKIFTLPDGSTNPGPMDVVIVDFVSRNNFYEGRWDPNNPAGPICYAIGKNVKEMRPSPNAPEPQAEDCTSCPMNQFGSDGNGKACKNTRLMAVLPPDSADPQDELMTLEASPTALKNFDAYVSTVAAMHGVPPVGVITAIAFHPEKTYPTLIFGNPRKNENVNLHFGRRVEAGVLLTREPDTAVVDPPVKKAAPKRGSRATRR